MTGEIFDRMAPGWYGFRHHTIFRTELEELVRRWRAGRLLNIGCGHGPDFLPFIKDFQLYGVDFSNGMLRMAQKYARKYAFYPHLSLADIRYLPFRNESFDWAIAVATYHHIEDKGDRLTAFQELKRVLKPGAEAFITAWNHGQPRFWFKCGDTLVPWRAQGEVLQRYYHLFSYGELERLVRRAGLEIIRSFPESSHRFPLKYFSRNVCLLVRKRPD